MAELLGPAGSLDTALAAIRSGADAVYFGGKAFSARKYAHNLDRDEIRAAVRQAHLFGAAVYVTVNIVLADWELSDVEDYLTFLDEANVDGIIVQDLAVAAIARRVVPDLPLHGSTQMTVADLDGVRFLEGLGFSEAVLSREVTLDEMADICVKTDLPIEVFIHGASCMAYSGQCLMSSFIGGRSGNRGACAQPCRLPYTLLKDGKDVTKEIYPLSLKDLSTIADVDDMVKAGVQTLKIEGRMKDSAYVASVVGAYRAVLDDHGARQDHEKVIEKAQDTVGQTFNRSFQNHFLRHTLGRRTITVNDPSGHGAGNGETPDLRSIPIYFHLEPSEKGTLSLTAWDEGGHAVTVDSDYDAPVAMKRPATMDSVRKQLGRLGGTTFSLADVTLWDETHMIPASVLNDLRRQAVEAMEEAILADYHRAPSRSAQAEVGAVCVEKIEKTMEIALRCDTIEGMQAALEAGADRIIFGGEGYGHQAFSAEMWRRAVSLAHAKGAAIWAATPRIVRQKDSRRSESELRAAVEAGVDGLYAGAMAIFPMAKRLVRAVPIYADWSLNIFNQLAAEEYMKQGCCGLTASVEMTLKQIGQLAKAIDCPVEAVVSGQIEMMVTESCAIANFAGTGKKDGCPAVCTKGDYALRDRKGNYFPVVTDQYCRNHILNCVDLDMAPYYRELKDAGIRRLRIEGRGRSAQWIKGQVSQYRRLIDGTEGMVLGRESKNVTRGHYFHTIV